MPQVALVGHNHTCPLYGHGGGPINSGQSSCTINGVPVAVVGDTCTCKGTDTIVSGHASVTINGKPVAIVGSATAHGGVIVQEIKGSVPLTKLRATSSRITYLNA